VDRSHNFINFLFRLAPFTPNPQTLRSPHLVSVPTSPLTQYQRRHTPSRKFSDSSMALLITLITLITLVEGGPSRPFDVLPREWRAYRLLSPIGGALANVRHRRVGTVSSLPSIDLTLNGAAALTGKTPSAHQERHQYWIAIAMQPFC